jgi:hypothetical protein
VEYNVDIFVAVHRSCQGDNTLLSVNQPAHDGRAGRSRIPAARSRVFGALPEQERRDWEISVERINELRSLALFPYVFSLELRDHDMARSVIGHKLLDLDGFQFQMRLKA